MVVEVPTPIAQPGMALVRTAASLVSPGTERMLVDFAGKSLLGKARSRPDLAKQVIDKARREGILTSIEAAFNRLDEPMPLGYSSAGTICGVGAGLKGFKVGQRVACAGGGYAVHAEYALVPQNLLAALPDNVSFDSAAFTTLGAIALHGFRLSEAKVGEQVTVIGLGLIGLLSVAIANAAGCRVLGIDLDPQRVSLAEQMGAKLAVSREEAETAALGFSRGHGSDVLLICADTPSSDPVELAGLIARDRAKVVATGAVGLEIPRKVYYEKELSFINSRSYGPGRYDPRYEEQAQDYPIGYVRWTEGRNLESFIDLMANDRLDVQPLITHRYPVDQAPQAFQMISGNTNQHYMGVLLTYASLETTKAESALPGIEQHTVHRLSREQQTGPGQDKIHLGLLGVGNFATAVMLPAVQSIEEIAFTGVASASGLSAQNAANKYHFQYATTDETRIIADKAINTIAILTRHNLHAQQVVASLKAGKHVFCEKPLAITSETLDEVFNALDEIHDQSQLLMVGFNRRFAPLSEKLEGFIGGLQLPLMATYRVNAGPLPASHWLNDLSQGGGRIIGEACHFIDYLTFLTGQSPSAVTAFALENEGQFQEDNVHITLTYPDGSVGSVIYVSSGDKSFPKERLEVFSAGRIAVLDDFRKLELVENGKRRVHQSRLQQNKGHRAAWQAFANAIIQAGRPPIPYDQLYGVTLAGICAVQALRSGSTVPIPGRKFA